VTLEFIIALPFLLAEFQREGEQRTEARKSYLPMSKSG